MGRARSVLWALALSAPWIARAQPYSLKTVINPGKVYPGHTLSIRVEADYPGKPDHVYLTSLSATNPGITVRPFCNWANPNCWKIGGKLGVWNEGPSVTFDLQATPAADTPPGNYSVRLLATSLGVEQRLDIPIQVEALPPPVTRRDEPLKAPNLPGLGDWRQQMTFTGELFCDPKAKYSFGNEREVWYYDGAWVFFQVYDYTGKSKWRDCALNVARQFRDYALSAQPPGRIPGWRVFTMGLRRAYKETGDASYRSAVEALVNNSPFAATNGNADDQAIRETAYLLRAFTDAHLMGIAVDPARAAKATDYLVGMADILFAGPPQTTRAMIHESFFDGLMAQGLTYYYDNWVKDPRIPPTIQKLCNWVYQYLWDSRSGSLMYNPFPTNPGFPRHCEDMCQQRERTLINLVDPAYFWYWRLTGDDSIRRKGDEMFSHALDDAIDDKGKSYSQNYYWSFDGVRWRTGQIAGKGE